MHQCPTCPARPGEYHAATCYGGSINYSDHHNRFVPPPTARLWKWRNCGPSADLVAATPTHRRAESAGEIET